MTPQATVPVFLAAERSLFVVLGADDQPVLTWDRDYDVALDFARIHNGIVVAVPVMADYTGITSFTSAQATTPLEVEIGDPADVFEMPHQSPPPAYPSEAGAEDRAQGFPGRSFREQREAYEADPEARDTVTGWSVGGRPTDDPRGWDFQRELEEAEQAAEVIEHARRTVGPAPAQVVADAYAALGVRVPVEAVEAIAHAPSTPPGVETLERIRDGLYGSLADVDQASRETWVPQWAQDWPNATVIASPLGEEPTQVIARPQLPARPHGGGQR